VQVVANDLHVGWGAERFEKQRAGFVFGTAEVGGEQRREGRGRVVRWPSSPGDTVTHRLVVVQQLCNLGPQGLVLCLQAVDRAPQLPNGAQRFSQLPP
jgi:hypothetical protein